jgi:hypothetical protein
MTDRQHYGDPTPNPTPSGASGVPGADAAAGVIDPRAADPTPSTAPGPAPPPLPAPTAAPPAATTQAAMTDLTAAVAATTSIEDSCVTLLQGVAAQFVAAAPGNAAVAQLSSALKASAQRLGQAITDCTQFAAPPVTPQQAAMGGTKSKR